MSSSHNWPFIINLGNSIIGVVVLTMPFCFQKCGIVLCMLILLFCTWLTLISCQLLMKAGITSRRRSYSFLAYYTHGAPGKFVSEVGMIGFQLGTLIAQIVVIGDLGPSIVNKMFGIENSSGLRVSLMILLCMTIGLPMALVKDIRAVSRVSAVCVTFYCTFALYVVWLSLPNLWSGDWFQKVHFWKPQGLFQSLPILSFSFGCQTQLFLLYDALPEPSLKTMSKVVSCAVNLCAVGYLLVGFCGYIAFYSHDIPGDIIGIFPNTLFTDVVKVCFVFSIVITFPVIIFPCRASIYTLLFTKLNQDDSFHHNDEEKKSKTRDDVMDLDSYIPARQFKGITISLVVGSMIIGVLIPNVEFILGLNGAIMGTLICYIFPALFYLKVMGSKPDGRNVAQMVLVFGITILLVSTYATLKSQDTAHADVKDLATKAPQLVNANFGNAVIPHPLGSEDKPPAFENKEAAVEKNVLKEDEKDVNKVLDDIRKEPPNPDPPDNKAKLPENMKAADKNGAVGDVIDVGAKSLKETGDSDKLGAANRAKELELQEKEKKQEDLLAQLEKQRIEQKQLIEEQKQLLKEFKDHHDQDMKQQLVQQQQDPAVQQQLEVNHDEQDDQQQPLVQQKGQQQQLQGNQQQGIPPQQPLLNEPQAAQQQQANKLLVNPDQISGQNLTQQQPPQDLQQLQKAENLAQQKQPQILPEQQQQQQQQPQNLPQLPRPQNLQQPQNLLQQKQQPQNLLQQQQQPQTLLQQQQQQQPQTLLQQQQQQQQSQNLFQQEQQPPISQAQQQNLVQPQQQEIAVNQQEREADLQHVQKSEVNLDKDKVDNIEPQLQNQPQHNIDDVSRKKRDVKADVISTVNSTGVSNGSRNESVASEKDSVVAAFSNETTLELNAKASEQNVTRQKQESQSDVRASASVKSDAQKPRTNEEMRRKLKSVDSVKRGFNS